MAAKGSDCCEVLLKEFEKWQETTSSETIFLLENIRYQHLLTCFFFTIPPTIYQPTTDLDGVVTLNMLLGSENEFKLFCPAGYPQHHEHFFVDADSSVKLWANALNEFLLDTPGNLSLAQVLNKGVSLYALDRKRTSETSEDDMSIEEDEEEEEEDGVGGMILSDDDSAFTTEWELKVARKKKRWAQKEQEVREELKSRLGPASADFGAFQASGQKKEAAKQIFTSSAASGILTNDLVKIMESEQEIGFTADPIDDNIYQWCVKLYNFSCTSDIAMDLLAVQETFGYNYIELQLDFAIDLYPFYPPLVKVIRPRLQASMMQRVTNMELLKLSYWNPAKDMQSVLVDIKIFLQHWARLEVVSERNDRKRYPFGSYVDIEHHLLRLALVSEVNPRANIKYHLDVEKPPEMKPSAAAKMCPPGASQGVAAHNIFGPDGKKKKDEYWAAGVGYGHNKRPEWDIKAYLAAQQEKDKQVEAVLHKILHELKILYALHAPQLKPRTVPRPPVNTDSIDPVEDMYNIIEGSALIPYLEQQLKADSFLEICRHTAVYKVIVDIIKEIAMQPALLTLTGSLPDQTDSIYFLLSTLEQKANVLLQHICKAGNGSIPKPPKKDTSKKSKDRNEGHEEAGTSHDIIKAKSERTAEEKLAREFQVLYKDVTDAFARSGVLPQRELEHQGQGDAEVMDITITTDENSVLDATYKRILVDLQFDSHDMESEGPHAHHYSNDFKKQPTPSQTQVFRIAQELTSLSSSLPLDLSSSIFVRTDDEKLMLMRALITGPEGTPYSHGAFQFDVYFPATYPKTPPVVNLFTTGGGTVRFNPNLYNCGKVCLSLLGTWEGQQGEQWNETTSTVLQILVSIQSLILVPEPYFNEPGYEQEIGTEAGRRHSAEYNSDVRINTIKYAMIAQLQTPSPGFEDVIRSHFYIKRERIFQDCEVWLRQSKSSKLERTVQNLKAELMKLQPPPNLANLCSSSSSGSSANQDSQKI